MTDPEVEHLLRATFSDRETQAPRLSVVRPKPRRLGQATWIAAGAATLAVLAGAIFAAGALRSPAPPALATPSPDAASALTPGWRWESSLGAQIQVPDTWSVNDYGCPMTDKPTVDRGVQFVLTCLGPESPAKEVAFLTTAVNADAAVTPGSDDVRHPSTPVSLPLRPVTVGGVAAERGESRLADGRYAGLVKVAERDVAVVVRTLDQAVTTRILDSLSLVDVDFAGCPVAAPPVSYATAAGRPAVPLTAAKVAICNYSTEPRLQSSIKVTGEQADHLLAALLAAKQGPNAAIKCTGDAPTTPDLVIRPDGGVPLMAVFSGCGVRGITDGERWLRLDEPLIRKLVEPLHAGYSFVTPLN